MIDNIRDYFLIRFAQMKITLFILFNNLVNKGKRKFSAGRVVLQPCSRVGCSVEIKLQFSFRKYISICTSYTVLIRLISTFFATCVELMVAATLRKNLRSPLPKWSNSDSFAYRKTKSCRQHGLFVLWLIFCE